jgi:CRISPR type III-B/RAMP module-associated protein Cmr5
MPKPTLEQRRAKFALGKIERVLHDPEMKKNRTSFLIDLRHLPAQLHWGGLGQTAASLLADPEKKQRKEIYAWLEAWLRETGIYTAGKGPQPPLIHAIAGSGDNEQLQRRYVEATREARALAVWLKKFAEAFLREAKGDQHGASSAPSAG